MVLTHLPLLWGHHSTPVKKRMSNENKNKQKTLNGNLVHALPIHVPCTTTGHKLICTGYKSLFLMITVRGTVSSVLCCEHKKKCIYIGLFSKFVVYRDLWECFLLLWMTIFTAD